MKKAETEIDKEFDKFLKSIPPGGNVQDSVKKAISQALFKSYNAGRIEAVHLLRNAIPAPAGDEFRRGFLEYMKEWMSEQ